MILEHLFCVVDDFCKEMIPKWNEQLINSGKRSRNRSKQLYESEIMTIYIYFQMSGYRNFKQYYLQKVLDGDLKTAFPNAVSYTRFVALIPTVFSLLFMFLNTLKSEFDGVGFIDSTSIAVCHNKRIHTHKVFKDSARRGKTTTGWFYGYKLHIICNSKGELCSYQITQGNCDDRKPVVKLTEGITGLLCGDKGYISEELRTELSLKGLKLITSVKKNMKNKLMPLVDQILLKKRGLIESTNNLLKNTFHLEHTRHRSDINGFANIAAVCIAYTFHPNKPSLKIAEDNLLQFAA